MVTHRSLCTPATRIIVVFFTLVMLTYPHSLARAQKPNQLPPIGPFGTGGSSKKSSAGVVTDGFKAFDALSIAERIKLLFANGPYEESQHLTSDIKLRVIVFGDAFILFQYGLESDAFAELTISVQGMDPVITRIPAGQRAQIKIPMPANYEPKPQVASLYIKARTNLNQPANIQIYELTMERDRAPDTRKAHAVSSGAKLAINTDGPPRRTGYEPLPLFSPGTVQNPSGVTITVSPLTTIKAQKQKMNFTLNSPDDYSGGRWEFWRKKGLNATNVWQKKTKTIVAHIDKKDSWDGTDLQQKKSLGIHFLQVISWNGKESAGVWFYAQTDSNLLVK